MDHLRLVDLFPDADFGPPATDEDIAAVEREIGLPLPAPLVELFRQANGFREPRGNAAYLWSLSGQSSLVAMTLFHQNELPTINDAAPDFSDYIFFGSSSGDEMWAMHSQAPHGIIAYHHGMVDEFEKLSGTVESIFQSDFAAYDES